ncbi:MAG: hypothetical protein ACLFN5_05330 [bacterium]
MDREIERMLTYQHIFFTWWIERVSCRANSCLFTVGARKDPALGNYIFPPGVEKVEFFHVTETGQTVIEKLENKLYKFGLDVEEILYFSEKLHQLFPDYLTEKQVAIPPQIMEGQVQAFIDWANELTVELSREGQPLETISSPQATQLKINLNRGEVKQ